MGCGGGEKVERHADVCWRCASFHLVFLNAWSACPFAPPLPALQHPAKWTTCCRSTPRCRVSGGGREGGREEQAGVQDGMHRMQCIDPNSAHAVLWTPWLTCLLCMPPPLNPSQISRTSSRCGVAWCVGGHAGAGLACGPLTAAALQCWCISRRLPAHCCLSHLRQPSRLLSPAVIAAAGPNFLHASPVASVG